MKVIAILVIIATCFLSFTFAHERRYVGNFIFLVGFYSEPTFSNQVNGAYIFIQVNNSGTVVGYSGAEETLTVNIQYQTTTKNFKLESLGDGDGDSGDTTTGQYVAYFVPASAGDYSFTFVGTLAGTAINEQFTSGSKFASVRDSRSIAVPTLASSQSKTVVVSSMVAASMILLSIVV
eukprot:TRINITY_DN1891_c0_g1_i1.p1 TRINITY_DN1891_c0_g1~~TRINITY_DN1891_c0_g1_i1.p1  ORF type:complete len:178 (-),score=42.50 TRINITY_DN1891_c0_g1_i1:51-584(-)